MQWYWCCLHTKRQRIQAFHTWLLLGLSPTGTVQSTGTLVGLGLGRAQNGWNQIFEGTFFILKHLRFYNSCLLILAKNLSKVHIFWEGLFNLAQACIVDGDFWVPIEIDSWDFQHMLLFWFREASQNLSLFRQLFFHGFQGGTKGKMLKNCHNYTLFF